MPRSRQIFRWVPAGVAILLLIKIYLCGEFECMYVLLSRKIYMCKVTGFTEPAATGRVGLVKFTRFRFQLGGIVAGSLALGKREGRADSEGARWWRRKGSSEAGQRWRWEHEGWWPDDI